MICRSGRNRTGILKTIRPELCRNSEKRLRPELCSLYTKLNYIFLRNCFYLHGFNKRKHSQSLRSFSQKCVCTCECISVSTMSSFVWVLFTEKENEAHIAVCNLCKKSVHRGSANVTNRSFSTTPLHKHAEKHHPSEYGKAKSAASPTSKTASKPGINQPTLKDAFSSLNPWDIKDAKSVVIHKKIIRMMALDNQPFSIVEDQGFKELIGYLQYLEQSSQNQAIFTGLLWRPLW